MLRIHPPIRDPEAGGSRITRKASPRWSTPQARRALNARNGALAAATKNARINLNRPDALC
jgi:hypothetical protein